MRLQRAISRSGRALVLLVAAALLVLIGGRVQAADPQPYEVAIGKAGDAELDQALHDASLLISLREKAPVGPFALIGRARDDQDRLLRALNGLGFYKGKVAIQIGGHPLDDPKLLDVLNGLPAKPPVSIKVSIEKGPLFHLGTVAVEGWIPAPARAALQLAPGDPAVAANVLAARERLISALGDQGYALAEVGEPIAILEESANSLDISLKVRAGPHVDIGQIRFKGLERMNAAFLRQSIPLQPGEPYDPKVIEESRQDLAALGVFSSVVPVIGKELDARHQLPVEFVVSERKRHVVGFTAEYATDLGASLSASWKDRNLLGNAEQLKLTLGFSAGGTAQTAPGYWGALQFIKPNFLSRNQSLQVDIAPLKESVTAYDRTTFTGSAVINRKLSDTWTGSIGVAGELEKVTQQDEAQTYTLVGLPVVATYDSTNDLLNPTRGIRASLSATPTQSIGDQKASFVILEATGSTYLDAGAMFGSSPGRTIVALRGTLGDLEGASQMEVPANKRFYAGGTSTVRGYKFQTVGPVFPDDQPQGGTTLLAGTLELRQRILEDYGAVLFVDAGQVGADSWSFSGPVGIGVGVGARYYTSIGPIRADLAVPVNNLPGSGSFEIYIGIGQAF